MNLEEALDFIPEKSHLNKQLLDQQSQWTSTQNWSMISCFKLLLETLPTICFEVLQAISHFLISFASICHWCCCSQKIRNEIVEHWTSSLFFYFITHIGKKWEFIQNILGQKASLFEIKKELKRRAFWKVNARSSVYGQNLDFFVDHTFWTLPELSELFELFMPGCHSG